MSDCLFCKIFKGEIPAQKVYDANEVVGFVDIYPDAKEHYLFIHKNHTTNINEMTETDDLSIAKVFKAIREFTKSNNLEKDGFRVVTNLGPNGCQSVFHTHFHVLGGEKLGKFGS